MKIIILASGSNGNSTYIEHQGMNFLIDCGLTFKALKERLESFDIDIYNIQNIFITHEHTDHVKALAVLANKMPCLNIFITKGTYNGLKAECRERLKFNPIKYVKQEEMLSFGDLQVELIRTHHDANEPFGLIIREGNKKVVYITDTGYMEEKYLEKLQNADMYILESNYDVDVLFTSDRPYDLKERINSDHGHLSNYDSAILLGKCIGPNTKKICFAHISEDCNFYYLPEMILKAHHDIYKELGVAYQGIDFIICKREEPTGEFTL